MTVYPNGVMIDEENFRFDFESFFFKQNLFMSNKEDK